MKNTLNILGIIGVVVTFVILAPKACTRPDTARRVLEQQGYKDITITGWRPLMAGQDDSVSTGFEATSPNGERVSGAVTGGFVFKGSTIRLD